MYPMNYQFPVILLYMLLLNIETAVSFIPRTSTTFPTRCTNQVQTPTHPLLFSKKNSESSTTKEDDPLAKGAWYAVEAFGNLFGTATKRKEDEEGANYYSLNEPPKSLQETLQRIKDDNDRSYFLSGEVDRLIYDEMCTFSDPFVSFEGRDRFISNLANLGSFITKYSVRPLGYEVQEDNFVKTKSMVKLELNLPWKPVLAWPWGVEYTIDPQTNLIVNHRETWDIEPLEGVKQIFRKATVTIDGERSSSTSSSSSSRS